MASGNETDCVERRKARSLFRVANAGTRKRPGRRSLPYLPDRLVGFTLGAAQQVIDLGLGGGGLRAHGVVGVAVVGGGR